MAWTTTQLLAHIRRVASLPVSSTQAGLADADLLAHADAQLQASLVPLVSASRDEHAIHFVDISTTAEYVRLPPRVAAGHLRDVTMTVAGNTGRQSLPRLEPEDAADWQGGPALSASSMAFVVQAGFLQLLPAPTSSVSLRISYVRTPPTLALVSACTAVTNLTTPGTTLVTATHAGTLAAGNYDFVLSSNGDSLGDSVPTVTPAVGSTTFAVSTMGGNFSNTSGEATRYVAEGIYLCPAATTCVIPLPDLLSSLLAYRAAIAVMTAIGDDEKAGQLLATADAMEGALRTHIAERVEGEPQRIRPRFQLRARGAFWRGW